MKHASSHSPHTRKVLALAVLTALFCLFCLFSLTACRSALPAPDYLSYTRTACRMKLHGTVCGVELTAHATFSPADATLTLRLTEPASLAGITVSIHLPQTGGNNGSGDNTPRASVSLEGYPGGTLSVPIPAEALTAGLTGIEQMFAPSVTPTAEPSTLADTPVLRLTFPAADGTPLAVVLLDRDTLVPLRLAWADNTLTVVEYIKDGQ